MNKRECNIIRDLLPLYVEGIVNEDTKQFVEEHICKCEECEKELHILNSDIFINTKAPETIASTKIIKKISFTIKKKRVFTAILASILSFIIAILLFAYLTAPEYIPYSEDDGFIKVVENNGIVTLTFNAQYELSNELETGTYYLSLYTTSMDQFFNSSSEQMITVNPNGEKIQTIYYVSNGQIEDSIIYGVNPNTNGGIITLPRLFLNYYFLIASFIAVMLILLYFIFRNKEEIKTKIKKLLLLPISYILSHLLIMGGNLTSFSATRDFYLILLLSIPIYLILYILLVYLSYKTKLTGEYFIKQ